MITVKAHFDGLVFVPDEPVRLPVGFQLQIPIETGAIAGVSTLSDLAKIAQDFPANPELPADLATQHDHYLYGIPKQS